jgi:hypothetical protein
MGRQPLYRSEKEKVDLVERNLFFQSYYVASLARESGKTLRLSTDLLCELHSHAMRDIYECAGEFRTWPVSIIGSAHVPPDGCSVEGLAQDMCHQLNCAFVDDPDNNNLTSTAAFLLWNHNCPAINRLIIDGWESSCLTFALFRQKPLRFSQLFFRSTRHLT